MSFLGGIPLFNYIAVFIEDLDMSSFKLFARCNINLGNMNLISCILYQQYSITIFVSSSRSAVGHLAGLIDRKGGIRSHIVSFRSNRLTQRIRFAGIQSGDYMRFLGGSPFLYYVTVLVEDLDRSAFQFFSRCNINLGDMNLCLCIFNQQNGIAILICGCASGRSYLSILVHRECCIGSHLVSFRCYCFT